MYEYEKQRRRLRNVDTTFDILFGIGIALLATFLLHWWIR